MPDEVTRAVMTSVNSGLMNESKALCRAMETAMSHAVTQALADGVDISDSGEIRSRMLAARQDVLDASRVVPAQTTN